MTGKKSTNDDNDNCNDNYDSNDGNFDDYDETSSQAPSYARSVQSEIIAH